MKRKSFLDTKILASVKEMLSLLGEPRFNIRLNGELFNFDYQPIDGPMVTIYGFRGPFVSDNETIEWKIKGPSGYDTTEAEENLKLHLTSCLSVSYPIRINKNIKFNI